jgi:hypothetical protein
VTSGASLLLAFTLAQGSAPPPAALSLVLSCGEQSSEVTLSIRNADQADTAVLIGIALANGRWYQPRELVMELIRSGSPEVEELLYNGATNIAGRMDHWVIALPAGATYALTLRAAEFVSTSATRTVAPPEELKVRLTGRPITSDLNVDMTGMKAWRLWDGSVTSNALRFSDCAD